MPLTAARDRAPIAITVVVVALHAAAVGYLFPAAPLSAIVLAGMGVAIAVAWTDVTRLALLAVPGVWLVTRLPGVDVSVTDVLVTVAGVAALIAGVSNSLQRPARLIFACFGFYLLTLMVTVLANHSVRSDLEVLHRIGLVGGGLLAGALLVREHKEHLALRALLLVTAAFSVLAVWQSVSTGFQPASPLNYNKNFLGSIAATTLLTLLAAAAHFRLPRSLLAVGAVLTALGLAASQSRAAMIAVSIGAVLWLARVPRERRRRQWKIIVPLGLTFAVIAGMSLSGQVERQTEDSHDSITHRLEVEGLTQALWRENPLTGVGVRFFALPEFTGYQPPNNVLNEILAEAGIPGLLGFLVFVVGSVVALWRCSGDLAIAAMCVVAARFAHGLVDIYWTGGTTTLPWLVAGMGLATAGAAAGEHGQSKPGRHRSPDVERVA